MHRFRRVLFLAAAAAAFALTDGCTRATGGARSSAPTEGHAPVLVTIVVDQLAGWVAAERLGELPATGGFARLRREGTWVTAMRFEHAVTDTAPGHSALFTGTVPSLSGISSNEVLAEDGHPQSILLDPDARLITADGVTDRPGSSLKALRAETLADRLRALRPDSVILSFSLKDRGALFAAGRHPNAALWWSPKDNRFVTSTAVAPAFPPWAGTFAAESALRAEDTTWTPLDPAWVLAHSATPDDEAGEGDFGGYGTVFPHTASRARAPGVAFRADPFSDDVLFMLSALALEAEHSREHPTLMALSLSANDYIGHTFGPDSWEAWDELYRLDRALARYMDILDALFGPSGYSLMLTADHGTTPMPETGRHPYCDHPDAWNRACGPAHRVLPSELSATLKKAAAGAMGPGDWVTGVSDPLVYVTPTARSLTPERRVLLDETLKRAALATPGVARVYDVATLPRECPQIDNESMDALVCRSVAPGARARGAEFYIVLEPGSFFDPDVVVGKGTSHGSPYLYDRTVPLLVRAPGRVAAGAIVPSATFNLFTRTASDLLGIAPPRDMIPSSSLAAPPATSGK